MPYLTAKDGTDLYYSVWGTGRPVVLVHGWAMGSEMWEYQVSHLLTHGFSCVVYDQRGCGQSDRPAQGYDFVTLADDLAEVLERLESQKVSLVGYSLGGGVIARYLSRHGAKRIASAVLIGSITPCVLKTKANPEGVDRSLIYEPFLAALAQDRPQILRDSLPAYFGLGNPDITVSPEMSNWVLGLCYQSSAIGMLALYKAANETDFRPDMAAFSMPTLILHGSSDPFQLPENTALRTAKAISGSRLELYEGASHGFVFTHKDRLNRDITNFLAKH
jgi:non-heme chloroperoxidase